MSKKQAIGALALLAGTVWASSSVFAQGMPITHQHPLPHPAIQHKPGPAPKAPAHGKHSFQAHGKTAYMAVQAHSKAACEHMAHHFVAPVAMHNFYNECMNTHHGVATHVQPHPDASKS